jgi:methyl-accepting chemotaxis protein
MTSTLANVIQSLLRGLGLRTINNQFFFSYSLIFLCAALTAAVLFMSAKDASQIDMAGAQRMLSQKMMKEARLSTRPSNASSSRIGCCSTATAPRASHRWS